ncbi:hypothetical protein [Spiroplasma poulsonii]|uniref:hypothetical protein n=1 Tax=Spiroplasma poulsonii TaxID=2138 RepID=UPI001F4D339B|nr:hypothetical protein [Spiroplasma poulsonii]UNF61886.1 hypothetical protein MNU24_08210 [Spiroplasma poulsonii]
MLQTQQSNSRTKPKQFKDVVLKAVKAVNSSLTESFWLLFIESKGEDWPINTRKMINCWSSTMFNVSVVKTNPFDAKIKILNSTKK